MLRTDIPVSYQVYRASTAQIRAVWAAVTQAPHASQAELAQQAGCTGHVVGRALHELRALGYIDFEDGTQQGRAILVPFALV